MAHREDDFPLVEEDCVRDRLSDLNVHKSIGPDGIDVIAEPLSIIFERSWRTGDVPEDWRKANVTPVFKKGKQAGQPHLHPGKGDEAAYPGGHQQASGGKEGYQE